MDSTVEDEVERCVEELEQGTLTAESLRRIAEVAGQASGPTS